MKNAVYFFLLTFTHFAIFLEIIIGFSPHSHICNPEYSSFPKIYTYIWYRFRHPNRSASCSSLALKAPGQHEALSNHQIDKGVQQDLNNFQQKLSF